MSEVAERLRARILAGGPVPFAHFMEEALYGAGGYYAREALPIGVDGDFVTGSSLSPLFGAATARLLRRLDGLLGAPADLLEAGCGGGEHLEAVIAADRAQGRRIWGWDRVRRPLPRGATPLDELETIPPGGLEGLLFSYELFDALPVHRLRRRADGRLGELWVGVAGGGRFELVEGELSDPALEALLGAAELVPGQTADLAPGWRPLYRRLAERLGRGLLVTCDYGFEAERLLDPRVRLHGTLACHRRQRVHRDPLRWVGEQDLSAHVDFGALRDEGEAAGLETLSLTRQALWLAACGIFEGLEEASQQLRLEAATLLHPEGMGEEIRVLVQAREVDADALLDRDLLAAGRPPRERSESTARTPRSP